MQNKLIRGPLLLVLAALFLAAAGCGTARNIYQKVTPGKGSDLNKRVLIMPVVDQQGLGREAVEELTAGLAAGLEQDRNLAVYRSEEPLPRTYSAQSPKFGIIIDPDLAQKAEEMGVNVLVTCVLNRYEIIDHGAGIWPVNKLPVWPLKPKPLELEVSIVVNALDISNGTLFLTHLESRRLRIPEDPEDEDALFVKEREARSEEELIQAVPERERQEALEKLVEEQAKVISKSLGKTVWSGRVLSAAPERIMINAGSDVGLSEGSVFEVFRRGDPIPSIGGRSVFVLGPKVGEIRIVKVMDKYSTAVPVSGDGFKAGQVIRERP
ncbi:MAG: hypothetical protein ACQET7_10675 [Thermodesulfobacteriota bacterium]